MFPILGNERAIVPFSPIDQKNPLREVPRFSNFAYRAPPRDGLGSDAQTIFIRFASEGPSALTLVLWSDTALSNPHHA